MKSDYRRKEQTESFAIIKERIRQFMENQSIKENPSIKQTLSRIQESLERIEEVLNLCTVIGLNWSREIQLLNHAIETNKISEVERLMGSIANFCEGPKE